MERSTGSVTKSLLTFFAVGAGIVLATFSPDNNRAIPKRGKPSPSANHWMALDFLAVGLTDDL